MTGLPIIDRMALISPAGVERVVEIQLDDWPLLLIDGSAGLLRVNDLRATHLFSQVARIRSPLTRGERVFREPGQDDHSILLIAGSVLIDVRVDDEAPTVAEVQAIEWGSRSCERGTIFDRAVRYRQVPGDDIASALVSSGHQ